MTKRDRENKKTKNEMVREMHLTRPPRLGAKQQKAGIGHRHNLKGKNAGDK